MKKCKYSINGKCTNNEVACERCYSSDMEMKSCTPFQRCVILHDNDWSIEVEEKIDTPTLDKMLEIQEQSELCGEFLDWFLHKFTVFERKQRRESAFVDADGAGDYINKEKLLAEFFDIDLQEAEREKESLLKATL